MMVWSEFLTNLWLAYAPELLLFSFFLLFLSGYPVAFSLGGLSLLFAWGGVETGLLSAANFAQLPENLFAQVLLNPAFFALPLLVFFAELLVQTGLMRRASLGIKSLFNSGAATSLDEGKPAARTKSSKRGQPRDRHGYSSLFLAMFLPAAIVTILVAYLFALPAEYLTAALIVPASLMFFLYMANWLISLWVQTDKDRLVEAANGGRKSKVRRSWLKLFAFLMPLIILTATALGLMLVFKVSLMITLSCISVLACVMALLQGKLKLWVLGHTATRATNATSSIAAMLLASLCFHSVFNGLGGGEKISTVINLFASGGPAPNPWLALFAILVVLILLGTLFDWLILVFVLLPLAMPIFLVLDFNSLLIPIWQEVGGKMPALKAASELTIQDISLPARLWLGTLIWLSLINALVTYNRQNSEISSKGLASIAVKSEDGHNSMFLFLSLQAVGLLAAVVSPQVVFWLPSMLIG